jgi:hypothetical protein
MDSESICMRCRAPGVQPISTAADSQRHGNPKRAVRFFCQNCCSVCDDVDLAPLSPCPIPWNIWKGMRKIPPGTAPLICRPIDLDTFVSLVRRLHINKRPGSDVVPREFPKYGPLSYLERYRNAINAFNRGEPPTVCAHEWEGSVFGLLGKVPAPILATDFRPIAFECTKFILATTVYTARLDKAVEDYQILDEA